MDEELCKVINTSKNVASCRGAKTLKYNMIHSKLPSLNDNLNKNLSTLNQSVVANHVEQRCVLCKNYLLKTDKAYHQTNHSAGKHDRGPLFFTLYKYKIKDIIDCNSRNVIYIVNDVCKISSVGCTADNMKPDSLIIKAILSTTNVYVKYRSIFQIVLFYIHLISLRSLSIITVLKNKLKL